MDYRVSVQSDGFQHPSFPYETIEAALAAIESSIEHGLYTVAGGTGNIFIQLGPGTVIKLMSLTRIKEEQSLREAAKRNPLLSVRDSDAPWKLVVQLGASQLPPLDVASEEAAEKAIAEGMASGVFRHIIEAEHDYLFVQTGPGTVFMTVPTEEYVRQKRAAITEALRQAGKQVPQAGSPLIGIGGGPLRRN